MPRSKHRRKPARNKISKRILGSGLLHSPVNDQRMSQVLLEFTKPYRDFANDDAALEKLIGLGVVAWNISLLPSSEREDALNKLAIEMFGRKRSIRKLGSLICKWIGVKRKAETMTESIEVTAFNRIVYEMAEYKLRRFAHNRRLIVSYHVEIDGDDVQLFVASTLEA